MDRQVFVSMKKCVLVSIGVLLLASHPLAASEDEETVQGPKLAIPERLIGLGELVEGQVVESHIELRNEGTEPLEIQQVTSSCLCATATAPAPIPPGATGQLTVTLDTNLQVGKGSTEVWFTTNDPEIQRTKVVVTAEIKNLLSVEPQKLRWHTVQHEGDGVLEVEVTATDGESFPLLEARSSDPAVRVEFQPIGEATRRDDGLEVAPRWVLRAVLADDVGVGPFAGRITMKTGHSRQTSKVIPFSGQIQPRVFLTPLDATFGEIPITDGPARSSRYWVRSYTTELVEVEEVSTTVEGIEVELETQAPGRAYRFVLRFEESLPEGPFEGRLVVRTSDAHQSEIEVPLTGTIVHSEPTSQIQE